MKKVAIYQNTISQGGRIRVIAYMTECLNAMGITPDWISYRNSFKSKDLENMHHVPLNANIRIINAWNKGLGEYKYIKMNKIMDKMNTEYDLIINSNNTMSGIKNGKYFLYFIYFPREARVLKKYTNSVYKHSISNWFFRKLYSIHPKPIHKNKILGISQFTICAIQKVFQYPQDQIELIYPPITFKKKKLTDFFNKKNFVVSIGRFDTNKDQISQIKIAQKNPHLLFNICGYTPNSQSNNYFNDCESLIRGRKISNVRLVKNATSEELEKILIKSKFFLHTMKDEPFGLGTVEAILHGCIPLVHASGGSNEIVNNPELMFRSIDEGSKRLKAKSKINSEDYSKLIKSLQERVREFDENNFCRIFTDNLMTLLK